MTSISEFERQKQERIKIIKDLIRDSFVSNRLSQDGYNVEEKELSLLARRILEEIDKV